MEYDEDLTEEYSIKDDVFTVRGSESLVPGLLLKTIEAMVYFLSKENISYDYVIRSNSSTVINFNYLSDFLQNNHMDYFCAQPLTLGWLDPGSGVVNEEWFGTNCAQGTLIGLSIKVANIIVESRHKLRKNLVDDVSIGVFIRENLREICLDRIPWGRYFYRAHEIDTSDIISITTDIKPIAWRNKSSNRDADAE